MDKHRFLRAVGFFVVVVAVLAFLALPDGQAAKGKPVRWKATVGGLNTNLYGSGEFVGGVDNVNINNGLGTNSYSCGPTGNSYSYLELQVFSPSLQFINMSGFSSLDAVPSKYGFPNTTLPWPLCIGDFLNLNLHPTADYPHVIVRFTTCGCGNTITDLMNMTDGQIIPVRMSVLFFSHIWGCPPSSPSTQISYLNLLMNAHGYYKGGAALPDIYIQRTGDTWTAYVDTAFDNSAYQQDISAYTSADWPVMLSDNILGQYATCSSTTNKKGKTTWTTAYHYPSAKAPLQFQVAFTKY